MASDEALHERLLEGDLSAFDALYERYERPLFGFIRKHLADVHEAEDALHETFLALLKERGAGHSTHSFRAWIYQVARHICLNQLRKDKRASRALAAVARAPRPPTAQPERSLLDQENAASLRSAVERLPQPLAELYALRSGGLSYAELAAVLGIPQGTVKSRMHQMVGRLRQEVES